MFKLWNTHSLQIEHLWSQMTESHGTQPSQCPEAAITKYYRVGGFNKAEIYSLTVLRPQDQNRGVGKDSLSPRLLGEEASCLFQLAVAPGMLGLWRCNSRPPCPLAFSPYLSPFPLMRTPVLLDEEPSLLWCVLILISYICSKPDCSLGHVVSCRGS